MSVDNENKKSRIVRKIDSKKTRVRKKIEIEKRTRTNWKNEKWIVREKVNVNESEGIETWIFKAPIHGKKETKGIGKKIIGGQERSI